MTSNLHNFSSKMSTLTTVSFCMSSRSSMITLDYMYTVNEWPSNGTTVNERRAVPTNVPYNVDVRCADLWRRLNRHRMRCHLVCLSVCHKSEAMDRWERKGWVSPYDAHEIEMRDQLGYDYMQIAIADASHADHSLVLATSSRSWRWKVNTLIDR